MSIGYIAEKLKEIPDIQTRVREADRLAKCFEDRLPYGGYNPPFWPGDPGKITLQKWMNQSEEDFGEIRVLCEGNLPEFFQGLYDAWKKRTGYSKKLLELDSREARGLHIFEYFPYWDNFDGIVRKIFREADSEIKISELEFTTELIGGGGSGEVYKARKKNMDKPDYYAVKLFFPSFLFQCDFERPYVRENRKIIIENIQSQRDFLKQEPFVQLRATGRSDRHFDIPYAYIMDFVEGQNVRRMVETDAQSLKNPEMLGRILSTYAQMLKKLHDSEKLFIDNSLDAIIASDKEIKICDFDRITPISKIEDRFYPHHTYYASRENILNIKPSYQSDLESFAMMIHHLMFRKPFLQIEAEPKIENKEKVKQNQRIYPEEFAKQLTPCLGEIVLPLISYPRNDSITIDDFIKAIQKDFGV
jgi:hypothetical protein